MLAKTGLLVVSNPKHINCLLTDVQKSVKNTLYIQLLSALNDPLGSFHPNIFSTPPKFSRTLFGIYSQASALCNNLDVRVLLTGLKSSASVHIKTQQPIDVVIFDKKYSKSEINRFISNKIGNISAEHDVLTIDCGEGDEILAEIDNLDNQVYKHVCLGGTFDRLHVAHKLLLSDSILQASEKITVGITEENMIHNKILWELIEDVEVRIKNVQGFVADIFPDLICNTCKIADPYGPAIVDPSIEAIVVSEETMRNGEKINEIRKEKGLGELKIIPIPLIDEPNPQEREEPKVSSSNLRLRLLGTLQKPLDKKNIPDKPYVIGLTGGIASGKSGVATHLQNLGVHIIDCDKLGHQMYGKNGPCYDRVVDLFGRTLLDDWGEIDRKHLGRIVFNYPHMLQELTNILWPAMREIMLKMLGRLDTDVVCVEAAVLCQADWDQFCHEVWTTLVPPVEAINRLKARNNLSEDEAKERLASQQSNSEYINRANVVFCPLWDVEYTKLQVHKAWALLQKRIPSKTLHK